MRIEQWAVVVLPGQSVFMAPECRANALHGFAYGHPRFADGEEITTSALVGVEDGKIRTKSGSVYELGEVDPKYEAEYPGARERILKGPKK